MTEPRTEQSASSPEAEAVAFKIGRHLWHLIRFRPVLYGILIVTGISFTLGVSQASAAIVSTFFDALTGDARVGIDLGGLIGLLVGGLGGWLWARQRDRGIPNPWLAEVGRIASWASWALLRFL